MAADKSYIAVVGCAHGLLDTIYETVKQIEKSRKIKVSLLICCGDFQGLRNISDLLCIQVSRDERATKFHVPRKLYDFHRYYSGEKTAPITTIFVGGNHEASNFLQELPYGGWVAPNIYYMGYAGVINFGSLRIAGISGIYKDFDYAKGRPEFVPYGVDEMTSVYHYRALEIFRLMQITRHVDIMLSHDWPKNIHEYGNYKKLYAEHEELRDSLDKNDLGSAPLFALLKRMKPSYWLSGHMHSKLSATVNHEGINESNSKMCTKFFAVDRAVPFRNNGFLKIIDLPKIKGDLKLSFDPEWLGILRSTNHMCFAHHGPNPFLDLKDLNNPMPTSPSQTVFTPHEAHLAYISRVLQGNFSVDALQTFAITAKPYQNGEESCKWIPQPVVHKNQQTTNFIEKFWLSDPVELSQVANPKAPLKTKKRKPKPKERDSSSNCSGSEAQDGGCHQSNSLKRKRKSKGGARKKTKRRRTTN